MYVYAQTWTHACACTLKELFVCVGMRMHANKLVAWAVPQYHFAQSANTG